jgi:hypothetical protein
LGFFAAWAQADENGIAAAAVSTTAVVKTRRRMRWFMQYLQLLDSCEPVF